jgi:hypothetical protein
MTDQTNDHATAAPTAQTIERRHLALLQTPKPPSNWPTQSPAGRCWTRPEMR